MTNYTLQIEGHEPYVGTLKLPILAPVIGQRARIPHDCERDENGKFVYGKRDGKPNRAFPTKVIPEPYRALPDHTIPVKNYPKLVDLLCELNPSYTRERALQLLGVGLAWCNNQWGVFHAPIITGGAVLKVSKIENGRVYFESIILGQTVPTVEQVEQNHLSAKATSVNTAGMNFLMQRPNGYGTRSYVNMFIVSVQPLYFLQDEVHLLPEGFEPPNELWLP